MTDRFLLAGESSCPARNAATEPELGDDRAPTVGPDIAEALTMPWTPTEEQQRIIDHDPARHARILAGPGTGKSATVIHFMLRLGNEGKHGRLLTFTRAATNELKEKVAEHSDVLDDPNTIHSFAIATLLANPGASGLPEPIRIADDWEWKELIREHLADILDTTVRLVDRACAEMASNWESLEDHEDPNLPDDIRNQFTGAWDQHRRIFGYSLLSELPFRLLRALEDHDSLDLGDWEILVVDEYQDLNQCDLSILRQFTLRGRTLIGAGDDDQSIYSFRRAHPVGIQRFVDEDYPGASDYSLQWARHVIEGLPGRPSRPRLTPAPHCGPGVARYLRFNTWEQEVEGVARIVKWLTTVQGISPEDVAIMFRSNNNDSWSEPLAVRLREGGIPVVDTGEVAEMLSERSNRKLLAFARLVVNREDSLAWWTMLHLERGIGPAVRDHFYSAAAAADYRFVDQLFAEHALGYPDLPVAQRQRVRKIMEATIELIQDVDLNAVDLGDGGWGRWLASQAAAFGGCDERFASLLRDLDNVMDREEGLGRFLSQVQPVGKDIRSGRAASAVRLMSMAASKGLTVRAAIVVGVEEGVVPHPTGHYDEERRLLYVAMTRSTEYLYLTWSGRRTGPTARTGAPRVAAGRNRCPLLTHGPVASTDGRAYLNILGA
jgi:DNA helicase-2/ATP-dependent DNA helicase PcrA